MAKKKGRPRTRTGGEIQVSVELLPEEYSQLVGYVAVLRDQALRDGTALGEVSQRNVLRLAWKAYWEQLPAATKRRARGTAEFKKQGSLEMRGKKKIKKKA